MVGSRAISSWWDSPAARIASHCAAKACDGRPRASGPEPADRRQQPTERARADHPACGVLAHRADATFERRVAPAREQLLAPRVVAARGAGEGERADPLGVLHGDDLADRSAHRRADDVRGLLAGVVEHGDRVVGHLLERVGPVRLVAAAGAPVVERDAAVPGSGGQALEVPAVLVGAETLDEQDRRAVGATGDAVVDAGAVGAADEGHQAPPTPVSGSQSIGVPVRRSPISDSSSSMSRAT